MIPTFFAAFATSYIISPKDIHAPAAKLFMVSPPSPSVRPASQQHVGTHSSHHYNHNSSPKFTEYQGTLSSPFIQPGK
ncbi:hypothetical protein AAY473_039490 [Plecturocebus cupreus]